MKHFFMEGEIPTFFKWKDDMSGIRFSIKSIFMKNLLKIISQFIIITDKAIFNEVSSTMVLVVETVVLNRFLRRF